jgi:hypothetical protein
MLRPGFLRGVVGFIVGTILLAVLYEIVRAVFAVDLPYPQSVDLRPWVFFAGFGGLFGWLWGVGTFSPYSHEHAGFEHHAHDEQPGRMATLMTRGVKATPGFVRIIIPWIRPLLIALTLCVVVVFVFLLIAALLGSTSAPIVKVQTDKPLASATTIYGDILLFGPDGPAINKTVFFAIIVLLVLGIMGGLAVVIALIMGRLGHEVQVAKQSPPEPPQEEPPLFRLIDFFVTWINDILESTKRTVER